nr:hypothetical protein [Tanacetum cinerariifolium]
DCSIPTIDPALKAEGSDCFTQ